MPNQHEHDRLIEAVDRFAAKMKAKLLAKAADGKLGGDFDPYVQSGWCEQHMKDHYYRFVDGDGDPGQLVDIANFAMFLDAYHERHKDDAETNPA